MQAVIGPVEYGLWFVAAGSPQEGPPWSVQQPGCQQRCRRGGFGVHFVRFRLIRFLSTPSLNLHHSNYSRSLHAENEVCLFV